MSLISDLKKKYEADKKSVKTAPLTAIIVGASGSGKSYSIGTLGVPTLYITTSAEAHGAESAAVAAKKSGGEIIPVNLGSKSTPDEQLAYLAEIMSQDLAKEGIGAVAIDSLSDLDLIIRRSQYLADFCSTGKGTKNNFKEGEAVVHKVNELIITPFIKLRSQGIHCFTTVAALGKNQDDQGNIIAVTPVLQGFSVVFDILRSFPDILMIQRVNKESEDGTLEVVHAFVMTNVVHKSSKDVRGQVIKSENFSCRVTGSAKEVPAIMRADLKKVLDLKG